MPLKFSFLLLSLTSDLKFQVSSIILALPPSVPSCKNLPSAFALRIASRGNVFRTSEFGLLSAFGLRTSDFRPIPRPSSPCRAEVRRRRVIPSPR